MKRKRECRVAALDWRRKGTTGVVGDAAAGKSGIENSARRGGKKKCREKRKNLNAKSVTQRVADLGAGVWGVEEAGGQKGGCKFFLENGRKRGN